MSMRRQLHLGWIALTLLLGVVGARPADARPTYFSVLTSRYSITPSDQTYACGNCHIKWTGTGARNPFGTAVEQQLYVGKSITQALEDLEPMDTDADGFSNLDELATYRTLPGYSCDNFFLAEGAPVGYDTFITPLVPSCLEPIDIRIEPAAVTFITEAMTSDTKQLRVINNGSTDPITVSSYAFLPGAHATLSVSGPPVPFDIPIGQFVDLDVTFAPNAGIIAMGTIRVASNDPDEAAIDITVQGFSFVQVLAAPEARARCLKSIDTQFRRYADRHRREWNRCFLDEVKGLACDAGTRDLKIQQAETRFRDAVGGSKDKSCVGENIVPSLLGLPATCDGGCSSITLSSMPALADCLVCRENEARDAMLRDAVGTAPPDSPPNTAGTAAAYKCQNGIATRFAKGVSNVQKILGRCEIANITGTPVDCAATNADKIAAAQAQVNEGVQRCTDSTGLLGCFFEGGTGTCLGDSAAAIGTGLVTTTFGVAP